jgi:hypothetical protein
MQFDYINSENGLKCKRLKERMKIKNNFKQYKQWATSYCFNS